MAPAARLVPLTVSVPVALVPETVSVAVPRDAPPAVNETVPDGAAVPLAAFTLAVRTIEALWAMLAGLAATVSVVDTAAAVTITVMAEEVEAVRLALPP